MSANPDAPWANLPWGLGAWGSVVHQWTPFEDKVTCIDGTRINLESGEYPKMRASISFNSLTSRIDEEYQPEMLDTFKALLNSSAFYDASAEYTDGQVTPYNEIPEDAEDEPEDAEDQPEDAEDEPEEDEPEDDEDQPEDSEDQPDGI